MIYIIPDDGSPLIALFQINEMHGLTAEVTEHPVEVGSEVSDHIRPGNPTYSVEAYVTNDPISPFEVPLHPYAYDTETLIIPAFDAPFDFSPGAVWRAAGHAISGLLDAVFGSPAPLKLQMRVVSEPFDAVLETQTALFRLLKSKGTSSIITSEGSQDYVNMVLVKVSQPRDEPNASTFNLDFKNIRTVTSATVEAPAPKIPAGVPTKNNGKQEGKDPKDKGGKASILAQALSFLRK